MTCDKCRYYNLPASVCQIRAPAVIPEEKAHGIYWGVWPGTAAADRCGEFEPKQTPPVEEVKG